MIERGGQQDGEAATVAQPAGDGLTAGAMLRQAREASGLHVAALAVSLKVPVRKLEALEDNRWDVLTDSVFVRALASSVCRSLKIDPRPILERLPQNTAPRLVRDGDGINTPFRAPSDGAPPSWLEQLSKPVYLGVFALLLGALVIILLPGVQSDSGGTTVSNPEPASVPQPLVVPPPESARMPASSTAGPAAAPVAAMAQAIPAAMPAVMLATSAPGVPKPASFASAPATNPATSAAAATSPVTAASGVVIFRTKGPSWVEVTDAKGVVTMRRQLEAGDAAGATGQLPLHVTIGRVDHTEVQVRGKPYDLRPVSRDNVARFEVK